MSEDSYLFESKSQKEGKWFSRLAKLLFFAVAFILVILTILANMGGPHDMYRESVERFTSEIFGGRPAKVVALHEMKFFPSVGVHATNIKVFSKPEDEGGYPVVTIGEVEAFMSFWSVATSQPKFKKFVIQNVSAIKGVFAPEEFSVHEIFVDHTPGEDHASLTGNGKIGNHKWSFDVNLEVFGGVGGYSYRFQEAVPFVLDIDDIHFEGDFVKGGKEFFKFNNVKITQGDQSIDLNIDAYAVSDGLLKIKGNIKDGNSELEITSDLLLNKSQLPHRVTGDIILHNVGISHKVETKSSMIDITNNLREILGYDQIDSVFGYASILETGRDVNIVLKFDNAKLDENKTISFETPYIHQNGFHKLGAFTDTVNQNPLLPPVAFVFTPDGKGAFVVLEGAVDHDFASSVFKDTPDILKNASALKNECGIGIFIQSDGINTIETLQLHFNDGEIAIKNQTLAMGKGYQDLNFEYTANKGAFKTLELQKPSYDFIQPYLHGASPNPTKCDEAITLINSADDTQKDNK
ncbi:MAG: hypothetical protein ACRBDI_07935 [Alphaproteobacteria bacterium]